MDEWTMYDVADPRNGTWNRCWGANPDGSGGRYGRMPCPNETFAWQDPPMFFRNKTQTERLNNQMAADWTPQLPGDYGTDRNGAQYYRTARQSYTDQARCRCFLDLTAANDPSHKSINIALVRMFCMHSYSQFATVSCRTA